ncbi:MAG: SUMF1/EgtB/PvdO family nonheme iron enzyme [Myxococcales bacterium]|nr:SUMF1/EgtB/PvdO family nonheme iron enzyme [Myxococcales bacterium]
MLRRIAVVAMLLAICWSTGCSHQVPQSIFLKADDLQGVIFGKVAPVRDAQEGWIEFKTKGGRALKAGLDADGYFVVKAPRGTLSIVRFAYQLNSRLNTITLDQPYSFEVKPSRLLYVGMVFVSPLSQAVYLTDDFLRDRAWFANRFGEKLKLESFFPNQKFYDLMAQYSQAEPPVVRVENGRAYIPGVRFLMGDIWPGDFRIGPGGADHSMIPPHEAIISSFWMDREPVSRAAFGLQGSAPIEGVSWNEADRFCREKGGRLPTEAEWELAARGPQWGNLNYTGMLNGQPKPGVDLERADLPANPAEWPDGPYGVRFRAVQLAEWTGDWFNEVTYRTSPLTDPAGPDFGGEKVVRVGPYRYSLPPDSRPIGVGFRCVYGGAAHRAAVAPPPAPAAVPPEAADQPEPRRDTAERSVLVALTDLVVYAAPSRDAAVIARIEKGTLLTSVGESGDFYLVRLDNGEEGFVRRQQVGSRNGDDR